MNASSISAVTARSDLELAKSLRHAMPEAEVELCMPLIREIRELKRAHDAVIVAHNYQTPAISVGIADFTGDSLAMARFGAKATAATILVCGVRFMAETARILAPPGRRVLLPASDAGCSLASSIDAEDVRKLRQRHPGVPIVAYVNTSAAVKAEVDVCCTSANAVQVVRSLHSRQVILVPDRYLVRYVQERVDCEVIPWPGACEVHERFTAADIQPYRNQGVSVLAHPECPPDVQAASDFVGSTSAMIHYLEEKRPARALLLTECSMADNVTVTQPGIRFERPCGICPHMKRVTLERVRDALRNGQELIELPADIIERARRPLARMLEIPG